jgi:hypothetical protein
MKSLDGRYSDRKDKDFGSPYKHKVALIPKYDQKPNLPEPSIDKAKRLLKDKLVKPQEMGVTILTNEDP